MSMQPAELRMKMNASEHDMHIANRWCVMSMSHKVFASTQGFGGLVNVLSLTCDMGLVRGANMFQNQAGMRRNAAS